MFYTFRSEQERAAVAERASVNRALMDRLYVRPKPAPQPALASIHRAIIAGDLGAVRDALTPDTVNLATVSGLTPLHLACYGYAQVVDTPTWHQANISGKQLKQEAIMDLLLAHGARVDAWDHQRRVPAACCEGKKLPIKLVSAMRDLMKQTAFVLPWMNNTEESSEAHVLNAFFAKCDITPDSKQGRTAKEYRCEVSPQEDTLSPDERECPRHFRKRPSVDPLPETSIPR
jgi:hypothetical protein